MPHITLDLSDDMFEALAEFAAQRGVKSKRAAATQILAEALGCQTDAPTWGGWRGNEASLKALIDYADRVSDKGRNDPTENDE